MSSPQKEMHVESDIVKYLTAHGWLACLSLDDQTPAPKGKFYFR
jgi:hypothetical protein